MTETADYGSTDPGSIDNGSTDTDSAFADDVYVSGDDDAEYLDPAETLTGDSEAGEGLEDPLDTSYSPPDYRPAATRYGTTELEQLHGESLDQRLAQEEPDIEPADEVFGDPGDGPNPRAGRLVAPDEGAHADVDAEAFAFDVGRAGNAASAEESAMHIVSEDDLDPAFVSEETLTDDTNQPR